MKARDGVEIVAVDTDVLSFIFKGDSRGRKYHSVIVDKLTVVSFMSVAELRRWSLEKNWGDARRHELETYLHQNIIVYPTDELCTKWAQVTSGAKKKGRHIDSADAWIAATALLFKIPLVTHNRSDFDWVDDLNLLP